MSCGRLLVVALLVATGVTAAVSEGGPAIRVSFALRGNAATHVSVNSGSRVSFVARTPMRRNDRLYILAYRTGEGSGRIVTRCNLSPCYGSWREMTQMRVQFRAQLVRPVSGSTSTFTNSRLITVDWRQPPPPPPSAAPGHYVGRTVDGQPWEFDVAADGRNVVKLFSGEINETCNGGPQNYLSGGNLNLPGPFPIAADGSFSITFSEASTVDENPANDNVTITGRIANGIASGHYKVDTSFSVKDRGGATANFACSSGDQTWTATRVG